MLGAIEVSDELAGRVVRAPQAPVPFVSWFSRPSLDQVAPALGAPWSSDGRENQDTNGTCSWGALTTRPASSSETSMAPNMPLHQTKVSSRFSTAGRYRRRLRW